MKQCHSLFVCSTAIKYIFIPLDKTKKAKHKKKKTKKVNKKAAQISGASNQNSDEEGEDVGSELADDDDHSSTTNYGEGIVRNKFDDDNHASPASQHSLATGGTLCFFIR